MSNRILETSNITKYFYEPVEFRVLHDISFYVNKGEFLTIVGKSGCGKSTLLYILSTMDTEFSGTLKIDAEDISKKSKTELAFIRNEKIGFIFQFHYLLAEFTSLYNVMIPALRLGKYSKEEIEHKAYEKLKLLELEDQALKPAAKLSGGQQQRVAIARSLINDPLLIMGDEPTGNLDSKNTENVFAILKEITQSYGQSIVAVTHDLDFAKASDRTIEMLDGQIISTDLYH